jgi:hypothetical protein
MADARTYEEVVTRILINIGLPRPFLLITEATVWISVEYVTEDSFWKLSDEFNFIGNVSGIILYFIWSLNQTSSVI